MGFQWIPGSLYLWISRSRGMGPPAAHLHVWAAVFLGGAICIFRCCSSVSAGEASTRHDRRRADADGRSLIHLTAGARDAFPCLRPLAFSPSIALAGPHPRDIVVALDRPLRGMFSQSAGMSAASQWRWLEHAAWV
jgi:hypothetical protein